VTGPGAIFTAQSRGPPQRERGDRPRARPGQKEALRRALQNCHPSLREGIKRLGLGHSDQAAAGRDRPVIVVSGFSARVRLSPLPRTVSWLGHRRDRPAIHLKNQRPIQLFQCSNGSVNREKLKRPVASKLLTLGLLVQCGLVSARLTRSGEFTASFPPPARPRQPRHPRRRPQSYFCALQDRFPNASRPRISLAPSILISFCAVTSVTRPPFSALLHRVTRLQGVDIGK
jgi:hypothetical protein